MFKKLLLLICLFNICLAQFAMSQNCRMQGRVMDTKTHKGLDSVKIEIYEDKFLFKIIYTDTAGRYDSGNFKLFKNLVFHLYRRGYRDTKTQFNNIEENTITFINFNMEKISAEEQMQIEADKKIQPRKKRAVKSAYRIRRG